MDEANNTVLPDCHDGFTSNTSNMTGMVPDESHDYMAEDAIWILTSTFIIFTMQSGFGLLESGSVTTKNEVNIMMKNAIDVIFGGLSYWMFGYGLSFGTSELSNAFTGWGNFFVSADNKDIGQVYSKFFFQASFATTATTIVSGAMAERTKLESYMVFSFLNTVVYCLPAHWVWGSGGWLKDMGVVDVAGAGPVHLVGGVTGLVATIMLKPRFCRYKSKHPPPMGSPTNALLGMFMLMWGWLGFNCGSTFGISGYKWKLAVRSAVSTLIASTGGGCVACLTSYVCNKRKIEVSSLINGILGSLVGITAFCALAEPWESLVIGCVGALISLGSVAGLDKLQIDDPVGCVGVHGVCGVWSLATVGLFGKSYNIDGKLTNDLHGLFYDGGFTLLGIQLLAGVSITAWTVISSYTLLKLIDVTMGLRVPLQQEILGADLVEHAVGNIEYDKNKQNVRLKRPITIDPVDVERPRFNEARKLRASKKLSGPIVDVAKLAGGAAGLVTADDQNPKNEEATFSSPQEGTTNTQIINGLPGDVLWKFATAKVLSKDETERRIRLQKNFQILTEDGMKGKLRSKLKHQDGGESLPSDTDMLSSDLQDMVRQDSVPNDTDVGHTNRSFFHT